MLVYKNGLLFTYWCIALAKTSLLRPLWYSSGQLPPLLLWWFEFESCWQLKFCAQIDKNYCQRFKKYFTAWLARNRGQKGLHPHGTDSSLKKLKRILNLATSKSYEYTIEHCNYEKSTKVEKTLAQSSWSRILQIFLQMWLRRSLSSNPTQKPVQQLIRWKYLTEELLKAQHKLDAKEMRCWAKNCLLSPQSDRNKAIMKGSMSVWNNNDEHGSLGIKIL